MGPGDELFQLFLFALGEHLHAAVVAVLDPTGEAQALGFTLRGGAEEHALHTASHVHLYLLQSHGDPDDF